MSRTVDIALETLTHEAFAPFGAVLSPPKTEPAWKRPGHESWRFQDFDMDGTLDLKVSRFFHKPFEFSMMERHLTYTETRMPLSGAQAIFVAAPSRDWKDMNELPDPASLRAFLLDGSQGLLAAKGTWHALDTFPVKPPHATFVILTEKETQLEIEHASNPETTARSHVADYAPSGIKVRVVDPKGLLGKK